MKILWLTSALMCSFCLYGAIKADNKSAIYGWFTAIILHLNVLL